jgi:hypothetical protein
MADRGRAIRAGWRRTNSPPVGLRAAQRSAFCTIGPWPVKTPPVQANNDDAIRSVRTPEIPTAEVASL